MSNKKQAGMKSLNIYILLFLVFACFGVQAQQTEKVKLDKDVKVVKPYEPVIGDAFKISELPKIIDTSKVIPKFEYEILPIKINAGFKPKPIKPARLISEPLSKLYYGYLRAGFGTYYSSMFDGFVGSKRSEDWSWGLAINQKASAGKVKNTDNKRVYAGYSNTLIQSNVKRFISNEKTISATAGYCRYKNFYHGYNPIAIKRVNEIAPLKKADIEHQIINGFNIGARLKTNYIDSLHLNYDVGLNFRTFNGKQDIRENLLKIDAHMNYFFDNQFIGFDASIDHYKNRAIDDTINGSIIGFSPWVGAFGDKWRVVVGVQTYFDQIHSKYKFSPKVKIHYNIIDYFLIPYFELDGNYRVNSYQNIYLENPYVNEHLGVQPTTVRYKLALGFRGNISSKVAFNAKASYSDIRQQYFFVNDTSQVLQNKFNVVYDNNSQIRLLGEVSYKMSQKFFLATKANYYHYNLEYEKQAWHMPNFTFAIEARYLIQDKIIVNANIFALGKSYAREFNASGELYEKELKGIFDLNLGVEYRLTKKFSAFVHLNNIGAVKYYRWNNYPSQRFNAMAGLTYSL